MIDNIKEKLANATDRNIIVYDADAQEGILTSRLLTLIKTCMSRNPRRFNPKTGKMEELESCVDSPIYEILRTKCNLHTIIVDKKMDLDPDENLINSLSLDGSNNTIKVEFADFDLTEYYKNDLNAHIQFQDRYVILAIANISVLNQEPYEEYLLGSC